MSGGFFRGTSADQDTRFSNKQAKLLKSQKFPPELDHLVDMSKVKMDVIRPWIATRATELLGFEDEVLINFVYGLLDVKVVDGKKIQIQLTGFMEKNTSKFMKELWTLLLSAQNNVSGVPQQFLDAKEEEQRKKKEENDKISQEIQKRRERAGRELEREKHARMEDEDADPKSHKSGTDMLSRPRDSSDQADEMKPEDVNYSHKIRNGHSISPFKTNTSPLSQRSSPSDARSSSKSGHSYGSYLKEGHKSRSPSVYSQSPRHSISPRRRNHSPVRRSLTPVRDYRSPHRHPTSHSPIRRRSPHPRRRSISRSWNRNSSPHWRRSHARRRSPFSHRRSISPLRRRSPSPVRRRSPPLRRRSPSSVHRRSHSPARHRSPIQTQRRSPSPFHRSSHIRHGSPSPARYESISPIRRSPLPLSSKYRKQSPQSPVRRHAYSYNSPRQRNRSPSPQRSLSPLNRRSSLKVHNNFVDRGKSGRSYDERKESRMPVHQMAVKGPDSYVNSDKSLNNSKFGTRKMIGQRKLSRSLSSSRSPVQKGGSTSHHESSEASREEERISHGRDIVHHKNDLSLKQSTYLHPDRETSYANDNNVDILSPDRSIVTQFPTRHPVKSEIQRNDMGDKQKGKAQNALQLPENIEYGPGGARGGRDMFDDVKLISGDKSPGGSGYKEHALRRDDNLNLISNLQSISKGTEQEESRHEREHVKRSKRKLDKDHIHSNYSDSDNPQNLAKKQLKRSDSAKRDISESSETDSQVDDKKEAKRKRKEDKRLRKEEKRRRREERRRRRSERRAAKQKLKTTDALSPPSDFEKHLSEADGSDGDVYQRKNSFKINAKEAESEQKRLEIELRMKALESLRAKKAIND